MAASRLLPLCAVIASGCVATSIERSEPKVPPPIPTSAVVARSRFEVWEQALPCLGRRFFIDSSDEASGLVKVSYSGTPERFLDGGTIRTIDRRGEGMAPRSTLYPVAAASQVIPIETALGAVELARAVELDASLQLTVEAVEPGKTRVSEKVRFKVTRTMQERLPTEHRPRPPARSTVVFDSGTPGAFLDQPQSPHLESLGREVFWSTGVLEADALACFGP